MTFLCCIYDDYFKTFVDEHKLCFGEDINGKVYFVLVDHLYKAQRACITEKPKYDIFILVEIRGKIKTLSDLMKPGAHGHFFCSSLPFEL